LQAHIFSKAETILVLRVFSNKLLNSKLNGGSAIETMRTKTAEVKLLKSDEP